MFLTAVVEGATEFTWQYMNPSIGQWADMVDTNGVSGSKWSELSVVVSDIWSRYQYRLVARNEGGQTISDTVTISILATPTPIPIATPRLTPASPSKIPFIDEAKLDLFRDVGSYVAFGNYEQDNNIENGKEPIEWLVLDYDEKNNRALLISRYGLDVQPYNTDYESVIWAKSTLRIWLNRRFIDDAFNEQEQKSISLTNVDNSRTQGYTGWDSSGWDNTLDKVFLLSVEEANRYLGVMYYLYNDNKKARAAPTAYAIGQGAWTSKSIESLDNMKAGWWWLRSPGRTQNYASIVYADGSLNNANADALSCCVRPALWINLESDIF